MPKATTFLTLDNKGRATFPEEVRQSLGVGAGDFILLERTPHGTFELVPAMLVPADQLWFHHPEMRRRIERAEADFSSKASNHTASTEEARTLLDGLKRSRRPSRRRAA